ncbi:MAG: ComF family protein [Rickettsiales bacterium]|nr:ComF family protein [Rickettsiales bacterium]
MKILKNKFALNFALNFTNKIRAYLKIILTIIFPSHCLYCQKIISAEGLFCSECWQKLQFITTPKCAICCNPFKTESAKNNNNLICAKCLQKKPSYDKAIVIFCYNQIIKKIIGDFKYRDKTYIAKKLSKFFSQKIISEIGAADFIIPIPLHKKKLSFRKFNQSLLLCQTLATIFPKTKLYPDFLLRIKNTTAQVKLKKRPREKNLNNAFILNPNYRDIIKGKNIILVDDVITTGTTIEACSKVLKKSQAQSVTILAIAKTVFN